MSTQKPSKINQLLTSQPLGVVLLSAWLVKKGYSRELQKRYKKSLWFESIGTGALIRRGDVVDYLGGLYALQSQLGLTTHVAAATSLSLLDRTYLASSSTTAIHLFSAQQEQLPRWFVSKDWQLVIQHHKSNFLPVELGVMMFSHKQFSIKISTPERALLECLYLAKDAHSLVQAYQLLVRLSSLNVPLIQELLEACTSIKVKRIFLFMVEKIGHKWLYYLTLNKVELGSGKRSLVKNGVYIAKYRMTVPREIA